MRRCLLFLLLLTTSSSAGPATPSCAKLPKDIEKQLATATKARDEAYAKALAAKKLTPWTGKLRVFSISDDNDGDIAPAPPPVTKGLVIDLGGSPTIDLVVDASGTVYRVERAPTGQGRHYVQCGCGPMGRGVREKVVHYNGELPPGTKFGGAVRISYPDTIPTLGWDHLQGGKPCKRPS